MAKSAIVVDDDHSALELVGEILRQAGYRVTTATTAREAVASLKREGADLLFTDSRLPDRDGIGLLMEVRLLQPELPCVLMARYASVESAVEALRLGVRDYVFKPITHQKIRLAMHRALASAALAPPPAGSRQMPPASPIGTPQLPDSEATTIKVPLKGGLREMNRHLVREVLLLCDGNKSAAARILGMHRRSLYRLLRDET